MACSAPVQEVARTTASSANCPSVSCLSQAFSVDLLKACCHTISTVLMPVYSPVSSPSPHPSNLPVVGVRPLFSKFGKLFIPQFFKFHPGMLLLHLNYSPIYLRLFQWRHTQVKTLVTLNHKLYCALLSLYTKPCKTTLGIPSHADLELLLSHPKQKFLNTIACLLKED